MLKTNKHIRHGDINIAPVAKKSGVKKVNSFVLAEGEQTGHFHKLNGKLAVIENDTSYFEALEDVVLDHPEHGKVTVEKGTYRVWRERERDPYLDSIRAVRD